MDYKDKTKLFETAMNGLVKYFGRKVKDDNKDTTQKHFALDEKQSGDEEVNVTRDFRNKSGTFPRGGGGGFQGNGGYGRNGRGGFQKRNGGGFQGNSGGFQGNGGGFQGNGGGFQRNGGGFQGGGLVQGQNGGGRSSYQQRDGGSSNTKQKPLNPVDQNGVRQVCS